MGEHHPSLPGTHPPCSARSQHRRLRRVRRDGDGVEGLVHVSEMDWTNKNVHPARSSPPVTRSRSWCWTSTRASSHLPGHEAVPRPTRGKTSPRSTRGDHVRRHQVDYRLRHLHRPGRRHRRPGSPVGHLSGMTPAGGHDPQLQEGSGTGDRCSGGRSRARAHLAWGVKQLDKDRCRVSWR